MIARLMSEASFCLAASPRRPSCSASRSLQRGHRPGDGLGEAERGRDGKLGEVGEVQRLIGAVERLGNVRLRTPDDVVGPLHHRTVGAVHADVLGEHKRVVEAFEDVLERYALFLGKRIGHDWLLRMNE
jgi:hypothetical protein